MACGSNTNTVPLACAGGGGGGPHVRLVASGHDRRRARRGSPGRSARWSCRPGAPSPRPPRPPARRRGSAPCGERPSIRPRVWCTPSAMPASPGADQRGRGRGQRRAQPLGFGDDLRQGQRRDRPPIGQRGQRVVAERADPQPPRPPGPTQRGHPGDEHDVDGQDEPRADGRPQRRQSWRIRPPTNSAPKSGPAPGMAGQGGGDAAGGPRQPDRRDGRPGADHHQPRGEGPPEVPCGSTGERT